MMIKKIIRAVSLTLPVLFLLQQKVNAQPFTLEEIQPQELTFNEYKKDDTIAKGRLSVTPVTQDKDTMYFFIKGLSMYAPAFFSITASDPAADIKINLCKENWKTAHQSGTIKGKGKWNTKFKTEGDFGIQVIAAKKPVKYALLVWTGNDVKVELPSPFKGGANAGGGGGWIKKNMLVLIIGIVAIAVIGFLFLKLKKAKK